MARGRGDVSLESLPNIGVEVAARLREAGIANPSELVRIGSVEAAYRLARARPLDPPCRSMLSGLEGAIRGVRWHAIPKEERDRIWSAYERRLAAPR
ncbi:MAG: TfoX/Sxy family DNA transformation protein [Candidatus Bipolaricaulota bacterium]